MSDKTTQDYLERVLDTILAARRTSVVRTAFQLRIFDRITGPGATWAEVAREADLHPRGARVLLNALAALDLIDTDGDVYRLRPGTEDLLVSGCEDYLGPVSLLASSDEEWTALGSLTSSVVRGGSALAENLDTPGFGYLEDWARQADQGTNTIALAELTAGAVAKWAEARPSLDLLDVACGPGWYGLEILSRNPHARMWAVDYPNILAHTKRHAVSLGAGERFTAIEGDMFEVRFGGPYDLVLAAAVLHHFDLGQAERLVEKLAAAVRPGGRLVVVVPTVGDGPPAENPLPYLFSVMMLAMTPQGEVHSTGDYERLLARHGFGDQEWHSLPGVPIRVLVTARLT